MNRIERLMWEKAQMEAIGPVKSQSRGRARAKVISVALLVTVVIALLATQVPARRADETMVQAPVAASAAASDAGGAATTLPRDTVDVSARVTGHDESPISVF